MSLEEANKALGKAKIALMSRPDTTFFITVCFSLEHKWDASIPTAGTNGKEIRYNPDFFMSLTPNERVFLIMHETLHVVFLHMTRLEEREHKKWNMAGDYVINDFLIRMGLDMPSGGLHDSLYRDMSTEEVYDILDKENVDTSNFQMDITQGNGTPEQVKAEIDDILVRASVQAQMSDNNPGNMPGEIEIYLKGLTNPTVPWDRLLAKFMNSLAKTDYTFKKPNRRFFPEAILPSQLGYDLDNITVAIDTSGSISDEQFHQFISETYAILKQLKPKELTLLQFDWQIRAEDKITGPADLKNVQFTGKGGTRIDELIQWAADNKPTALLVFTDGYFRNPNPDPKIPIFWIIHSNENYEPPYGTVIQYPLKKTSHFKLGSLAELI